ncbi:spore coat protein [Peribacillus alkalitolerans]|uniref:spore coat protein n=1 Tax=Peribacillus alkalitolerans TaxID=1550385 RepID=UPI0013CFCD12|nr:spore coat protein [Peribacillus alkalitolerans]
MNQHNTILKDEDLVYTILADLKRTSFEYAIATTESNCPVVRQKFQLLLNDSLQLQGQVYNFMSQNNMYNTSGPALSSDISKQIQEYSQTKTQTSQLIQQNLH